VQSECKLLPCEEDFCRFELGSRTLIRRAALLNSLFSQLNLGEVVIEKLSSRINYDAERCISCGYCAFVCPYDALEFAAESTTVRVNEEKCMGCGRCVSICPVFALELDGFPTKSFEEMVSEALKQGARRIHFGCRWSDYERFDEMRVEGEDAFIPVVCSGFVSENLILHALCEGAQEVFLVACSGDDCRLKEGNRLAEERVEKLKKLLESIGVHEKVHLVSSSPKFILREGD